MKKFLLATLFLSASGLAAEGDLVYVDFDRIYAESKVASAVVDDIKAEFGDREKSLRESSEKIKSLREELEKESLTLGDAEKRAREQEIGSLEREFVRERSAFGEDFNLRLQERRNVVDAEIERIIRKLAEENKYGMVINPYLVLPLGGRTITHNIILYADDRVDITDEVIDLFDKEARVSR
jgi:outer membrane protein